MKLEVGESLSLSWLRHVRGCEVVQLDWKISPKAQEDFSQTDKYKVLKGVYAAARETFDLSPGDDGRRVFKTNVNFDQFILQGEIDALGLKLKHLVLGHTDVQAFAVEVAFHEGGLNYGGKSETAARVAKKMLRNAILLSGPLGVESGEIIFATPKIGKTTLEGIMPKLDAVMKFWKAQADANELPNFNFHFYGERDFNSKLLLPLLEAGEKVADTSELFLRSYQLLHLFNNMAARD